MIQRGRGVRSLQAFIKKEKEKATWGLSGLVLNLLGLVVILREPPVTCALYKAFYVGLYHHINLVDVIHWDLEAHQVEILEPIVVVYIIQPAAEIAVDSWQLEVR